MRKLLLFPVLSCLALTIQALPVSESEARQKAQAFLEQRGKSLASASRMSAAVSGQRAASGDGHNSYYVFNVGSGE